MIISKKNNQGFTLLEMLVVMIIIGILAAIGLRTFSQSRVKSRDAKRKSDLEQIQRALDMYRTDHGHYPVNTEDGELLVWRDGSSQMSVFEWGQAFKDPEQIQTIYMPQLPDDPSGMRYYYQAYQRDTTEANGYRAHESSDIVPSDYEASDYEAEAYKIFARLENPMDQQIEDLDPADVPDCSAAGSNLPCNYFIYSLNIQPGW